MHLLSVNYQPPAASPERHPFTVPLVQSLDTLAFETPVTILVGENGTGKSTLLEALAVAANCTTIGSESVSADPTLAPARELARQLKLSWRRRTHRGFFLRSEDFFNFCRRTAALREELQADLKRVEAEYGGRSRLTQALARTAYVNSLNELDQRYGTDLAAQSHGESFLQLFQARFVPDGLYILDEPETPLSPTRQLALMAMIAEMVEQGCQFVIATHSPILMAYPGATILSCDQTPLRETAFEDLEHVRLTRDFLNDPGRFLHYLRRSED